MPAWKVALIGLLATACLGLALATLLVPMSHQGNDRWLWLAGLLVGTTVAGSLLTVFMRHASSSLDRKTRGSWN